MVVYGILQYQNIPQKARKLPFWYSMVVYGIFRFRASLSAEKEAYIHCKPFFCYICLLK